MTSSCQQESSAHRYDSMPTYFGYYPMTSIECKLIKSILSNITGMRLLATKFANSSVSITQPTSLLLMILCLTCDLSTTV
ncbi:unnamed protein product [Cylicocyclus nassatus]|uniref:Uncharacterized protein n=1 Tax=Cylicocyclus nassatus TaxID=53992 RepID=A0AA36M430_CYLNA|nr:unnamed protein product [Cylicocyclus nassatus]